MPSSLTIVGTAFIMLPVKLKVFEYDIPRLILVAVTKNVKVLRLLLFWKN